MTFCRRLGVLATAVSGLLAAALLLSAPAFAWSSELSEVHSRCPSNPHPDQTHVSFTLTPFQGHEGGSVSVAYSIDGGDKQQVPEGGLFNQAGKKQNTFTADDESLKLHFFVPSPDTEGSRIHLFVTTNFINLPEGETAPVKEADVKLVVCKTAETTTTTSTTSPTPTTEITPTTVVASSTTESAVGALGVTTTTTPASGGSLPFTGANAMPILVTALALVLGGGGLLIATRFRGRHAK
jgi:hypothetical protein